MRTRCGAAGDDTLWGAAGDNILYDAAADVSISGSDGRDSLAVNVGVTIDLSKATTQIAGKSVTVFQDVDASTATAAVILTGSAGNNQLVGDRDMTSCAAARTMTC